MANPQVPNLFPYNGNPNGHQAGFQEGAFFTGSPPDLCVDYSTGTIYTCTTTGNAASAVWTAPSGGAAATQRGAANVNGTISGNLTLTGADAGVATTLSACYQEFTTTTWGLFVILPDATTVSSAYLGSVCYRLKNTGTVPVFVKNNGGDIIGISTGGSTLPIVLEAQGSASGVWRMASGRLDCDSGIDIVSPPVYNPAAGASSTHPRWVAWSCQMPGGFFLQAFNAAAGGEYVQCGITVNGTTNYGALVATGSPGTQQGYCISLSATEALYTWNDGTDQNWLTIDINTSTLACTINAAAQVASGVSTYYWGGMSKISSSVALVSYRTSSGIQVAIASISAGAVSIGTPGTLQNTAGNNYGINPVALSATLGHVIWNLTTSVYIARIVISGTSVTPGTPTLISSRVMCGHGTNFGTSPNIDKLSATSSVVLYGGSATTSGGLYVNILTDTGSAITQAETALVAAGINSSGSYTCSPTGNGSFLVHEWNNVYEFPKFGAVRVTAGTPVLTPFVATPGGNPLPTMVGGAAGSGFVFDDIIFLGYGGVVPFPLETNYPTSGVSNACYTYMIACA